MIHLKLLDSDHDRQLPLIASRHILDAFTALGRADLHHAAILTRAAADKSGEFCARLGRVDLREQFAKHSLAAKLVRDRAAEFERGEGTASVLRLALLQCASIVRLCVDGDLRPLLTDDALIAAGVHRKWFIELAVEEAALRPGSEFDVYSKLPARTDADPMGAFIVDLRHYATWLRTTERKIPTAWHIAEFTRLHHSENPDELCAKSLLGTSWRGHTIAVSRAELDRAGYNLELTVPNWTRFSSAQSAAVFEPGAPQVFELLAIIVELRI
jgi:hypothetical protein